MYFIFSIELNSYLSDIKGKYRTTKEKKFTKNQVLHHQLLMVDGELLFHVDYHLLKEIVVLIMEYFQFVLHYHHILKFVFLVNLI